MDLLRRIKAILATPEREWPVIANQTDTVLRLLTRYVAILALIPALAHVVGASLVGGYTPLVPGLAGALVIYVSSIAVVVLAGLLANGLAPSFGARKDLLNAFRLVFYSATPAWLAGIFLAVPGLSFLIVLGLYGAYPLRLGLPVLMRTPDDKSVRYAAALVLGACVIAAALGVIASRWLSAPR